MPEKQTGKYPLRPHTGQDNSAPYPVSRMAPAFDLVDLAKEISQADATLDNHVNSKLSVIADQIRHLQQQAHKILEQTQKDQLLHRAECQFKRQPGKVYHLYQKQGGRLYFSLLSPQDWQQTPPHTFIGSYRLENDMSWTDINLEENDESQEVVQQLISGNSHNTSNDHNS